MVDNNNGFPKIERRARDPWKDAMQARVQELDKRVQEIATAQTHFEVALQKNTELTQRVEAKVDALAVQTETVREIAETFGLLGKLLDKISKLFTWIKEKFWWLLAGAAAVKAGWLVFLKEWYEATHSWWIK